MLLVFEWLATNRATSSPSSKSMIHVACSFAIAPDADVLARHSVSVSNTPLIAKPRPRTTALPDTVPSYDAAIVIRRVAPEVFFTAKVSDVPSEMPEFSPSRTAVSPVDW